MNQQSEQLYAGISYSYCEYIDTYIQLLNHPLFYSVEYLDEEAFDIKETLKEYFIDFPAIINPHNKNKEEIAKNLLCIRERIETKYRTLLSYQQELALLLTLKQNDKDFIASYLKSVNLDTLEVSNLDISQLVTDCTDFIFKETSGEAKQKRSSLLFPCIPIKITKDNYLNYVSKSIQHIAIKNNKESAEYLVSILKQLFDSKSYKEYGHHFKDIELSIEEMREASATIDLFEDADLLNETIENSMSLLTHLFKLTCTFSNLLIFDSLDFNELSEMHASFFDLFHSLKNIILQKEDSSLLLSTLTERMEEIHKEVKETYEKACKNATQDPLFNLIQTYLAMDMTKIFGFSTAKHSAYTEEVLAVFGPFIEWLRASLNALPNVERKMRMQHFLSQIPFVMNEANFKSYIEHALSNKGDMAKTTFIASQLTSILEKEHFFPEPKDTPVVEETYEEDDEAAAFIKAHQDLFNSIDD